jgi:hypothetical protein
MDQDFHYYATYYAASKGGYGKVRAQNIAKAANFIDFLSETTYAGYWEIQDSSRKKLGTINAPRYSFQAGLAGSGVSPDDGLWSSFHFLPGNYTVDRQPNSTHVHGSDVAQALPGFELRNVERGDVSVGKRLTRPQSALSCAIMLDSISLANDTQRVKNLLACAKQGVGVDLDSEVLVEKFSDMISGIRAHVVADTWAHQDWIGIPTDLNTYDNDGSLTGCGIKYDDTTTKGMKKQVLRTANQYWNENLVGAPNGVHLGHGWMGHLPDFSFVKYEYLPLWMAKDKTHLRDNPTVYRHALLELSSFLHRCNDKDKGQFSLKDPSGNDALVPANAVIDSGLSLEGKTLGRVHSANQWRLMMHEDKTVDAPTPIDVALEPSNAAVMEGNLGLKQSSFNPISSSRYGTFQIAYGSELHLFQLAADYHFQFVSNWLDKYQCNMGFKGSWAAQEGPFDKSKLRIFMN